MSVDIEAVVRKYVECRDACERIDKETKGRKAPLEAAMKTLETVFMKLCNDQGVTQFKTDAGTAFIQTVTRCASPDFEATLKHIVDTGEFNLLNRSVNKTAVAEYIEKHEQPPPGVSWTVSREIQVRRPS